MPHTVVDLSASQVEEYDTVDSVTFGPEQWAALRKNAPSCPKRLNSADIVPWDYRDCSCALIGRTYGIALSRTRLAVVHGDWEVDGLGGPDAGGILGGVLHRPERGVDVAVSGKAEDRP